MLFSLPAGSEEVRFRLAEAKLELGEHEISIGRDPRCHMVIPSPDVSRRHARIETRLEKFVLVDQSVNGTFVKIADEVEVDVSRRAWKVSYQDAIATAQSAA